MGYLVERLRGPKKLEYFWRGTPAMGVVQWISPKEVFADNAVMKNENQAEKVPKMVVQLQLQRISV